jgi:hypothetical protein
VSITTKVVSSKPVHGEVYSIQHYEIKFVSDLRQVGGFLRVLLFPPPNIVESGVKHHKTKPNQSITLYHYFILNACEKPVELDAFYYSGKTIVFIK